MADWKNLPDDSRVWIYQADRLLTDAEVAHIQNAAKQFVEGWSTHGTPLQADIDIFDHLFLMVMVDEHHASASGCSIDKSVAFVRAMENDLKLSFMDRMKVAVEINSGIELVSLHALSDLKQAGKITDHTLVHNPLVKDKKEFLAGFKLPISESWHKQFLN